MHRLVVVFIRWTGRLTGRTLKLLDQLRQSLSCMVQLAFLLLESSALCGLAMILNHEITALHFPYVSLA